MTHSLRAAPAGRGPEIAGGLRERKKNRTRKAIYDAAAALFLERGYPATTIADIAERADVSPRTFFSYFASKEAVLFNELEPAFQRLEAALSERPHGGTALQVLRRWIAEDVMAMPPRPPEIDALIDGLMEDQGSAMLAYGLQVPARIEGHLSRALALDMDSDADDPTPVIVAAAAVAALHRSTRRRDGGPVLGDDVTLAHLDVALAFIQHGLDGLARLEGR